MNVKSRLALVGFWVACAAAWFASNEQFPVRVFGVVFFVACAWLALRARLFSNYWPEWLFILGVVMVLMGSSFVLTGSFMMVPAIVLWTGRAWSSLQDSVVKAGSKKKENKNG